MSRGGARPGAGRKLGSVTKKTREVADQAIGSGETPLEYLLKVMRDPDAQRAERTDAAKAAAPYMHAKLSSVEVKADVMVNDVSSEPEPTEQQWLTQHAG